MLNLLYITMRALLNDRIPNRLIRSIFELKALVLSGEYPQTFECVCCGSRERLSHFSPVPVRLRVSFLCAAGEGCPAHFTVCPVHPAVHYCLPHGKTVHLYGESGGGRGGGAAGDPLHGAAHGQKIPKAWKS